MTSSAPDQAPAGERRRWVRVSAACNNRCCFCLDRPSLTGELRAQEELLDELREGRTEGATRAVLSGGEPTLHPRLPELIAGARAMGYRWVQIITNGRRLAYPSFLHALLEAGLDEVTFSLHGSSPEVHDAMVGVPGAFEQAFAGLRAALAAELVVSVDVVLTRRNLADVPALIRRTLEAGVREYDLLWLTPFGAADEHLPRPGRMFLGPADAPALHRVFDVARAGGAVVWTNRVPIAWLEGYEELAQSPAKLEDELRGRRPLLDRLVHDGGSLACRDRLRCARCPFDAFCARLHPLVAIARGERRAAVVRWDPASEAQSTALGRLPPPARVWLRTERPPQDWRPASHSALRRAKSVRLEAAPEVLLSALDELPRGAVLHIRPSRGARSLPVRLLQAPHEIVVPLTAKLAAQLAPVPRRRRKGALVVAFPSAEEGAERGWPYARGSADAVRRWLRAATAAEDFPPCLAAGRPVRPRPAPFDLRWLDADGRVDPLAVLRDFIAEEQRAWSLRCRRCALRRSCHGVPWGLARDAGLAVLRPVPAG
jgi:pyruvate-formate lyase-activating enzyme